ncbi:isoprenylcysteine carboxylmethyltransferase family protein [Sulfitobacter albidus]|uniref:Isoprenylcysteine carboxylmethyltransferase family protein n=1 Tax=Sulfitobacter albidus TaxID=2829501 RepID=A0A975JHQ1_9RHOB|nr:isoprenylcysteine carboxylmethyltransferase family protein [Sulfitobacter albidus]QUJ78386.1 isoprenylcysteine carboxylmethyltransferase family protein [Sulfitobacter albidus]
MKGFPDLPPLWWAASIALIYAAKWALPELHVDWAPLSLLSTFLLGAALGLVVWSAWWFWRKRTPIEPHHTPKTLIVEGPYKLSRNPIYLALVMLTVSSALGNGSLIGLLAAVALWRVLDVRFAAREEALLIATFGDEARAYLGQTRRWI